MTAEIQGKPDLAYLRDPTPVWDRDFWEKAREMHFECVKNELEALNADHADR